MIRSAKKKQMQKKSNNINKYRMQFHLENKSLSIDSSWVDCQQNLKSLSREIPFRADTHTNVHIT